MVGRTENLSLESSIMQEAPKNVDLGRWGARSGCKQDLSEKPKSTGVPESSTIGCSHRKTHVSAETSSSQTMQVAK